MAKYLPMNSSPSTTGFNEADIMQIVDGMFDENKTPKNLLKVEGHGRVLKITFTNRTANNDYKSETRVLATNEAMDAAKAEVESRRTQATSSFTMDFGTPTALSNSRTNFVAQL